MARTRKERDWNYYKPFLQQYCLGNLSYSDKIPPHAAYYQRKFFAPGENVNRGTGSITLFDPTNPREGHQLTMWKDWSDPMGKAGDIYALVMKNEHLTVVRICLGLLNTWCGRKLSVSETVR
jgi:hypothetical protein